MPSGEHGQDSRTLAQVARKRQPLLTLKDCDGDKALYELGTADDQKTYRARIARMRVLALDGRGPLAKLERWLASFRRD